MSTISFQCYSCHQVLKVGADKAGKKGKCPKCGTMLTIPVASTIDDSPRVPAPPPPMHAPRGHAMAPPPFDPTDGGSFAPGAPVQGVPIPQPPLRGEPVDDDDYEAPRGRRDDRGQEDDYGDEEDYAPRRRATWTMPKIGLLIDFISFLVVAGAYALWTIFWLLATIQLIRELTSGRPSGGAPVALLLVYFILFLMGCAGALAGYIFCILGPNKNGTMPLAITTTALAGGQLVLVLIFIVMAGVAGAGGAMGAGGPPGMMIVFILSELLFAASVIVFCFYMQAALIATKKRRAIAGSPMIPAGLMVGCAVVTLITRLIPLLAMRSGGGGPALGWILLFLMWVSIGLFIAFLIPFILLLWRTRSVLR